MKRWSSFGCSLALAIVFAVVPSVGARPSTSELLEVRGGDDWTQCTHFGPKDGNCTDCNEGNTMNCSVSRPNAQCVAYVNNTNCLACKVVNADCPGNKLTYPDSDCPNGTPTVDGCCESTYEQINVASCAEVISEDPRYTCPEEG